VSGQEDADLSGGEKQGTGWGCSNLSERAKTFEALI